MSLSGAESITLRNGAALAEIAPAGAEARRWRVGRDELLWNGRSPVWNQISPLLFPVVGWTRNGALVDGRRYPLGLHGFAASQPFEVEALAGNRARLGLRDNAATRSLYPFAFRFLVDYRLGESSLNIELTIENAGDAPMPYACGLHPGFAWPFASGSREGAQIVFSAPEEPLVPVIAPGGLISERRRPVPLEGTALRLTDALFANDALCFLDARSRFLRFEQADGSAIAMDFPGFRHVALWTKPGAAFLCLEAWTGRGDPEGFDGELKDKPGVILLAPGERAAHAARYSYSPAGSAAPAPQG